MSIAETKRRAQELARRLEHDPKLLERFESILDRSQSDELKTLDAIEEVLVEEVRKLGGETLGSCSSKAMTSKSYENLPPRPKRLTYPTNEPRCEWPTVN